MKVKVTIERIEEGVAVLKTENDQIINWPKNKLPENARPGMSLDFFIGENGKGEDDKKLAKEILNELLGDSA